MDYEEFLKNLVQDRPILWNKQDPQWVNTIKKNAAWNEVYTLVQKEFSFLSNKDILDTWNSLKRRYKDALKEYQDATYSGAEFPENVNWDILREYGFLKNSISNRPVISTVGSNFGKTQRQIQDLNSGEGCSSPRSSLMDFQEVEEERRTFQGPSMWASARPLHEVNAVYKNQLREVVPRCDPFAEQRAKMSRESMDLMKQTAEQLKDLVTKVVCREEKQFEGDKQIYFELLKETFRGIPTNRRCEFYLHLQQYLENIK